jgi:hypothetical protein
MEQEDNSKLKSVGTHSIKKIDFEEDYKDLREWFTFYKWDTPPIECLPNTTFLLQRENRNICSASLYLSESGNIAFVEWVIMNPTSPKKLRVGSLPLLLTYISSYAIERGCKFLFTTTKSPQLIRRLKGMGFQVSDEQITNLIKVL